jgi:hypothetical protein
MADLSGDEQKKRTMAKKRMKVHSSGDAAGVPPAKDGDQEHHAIIGSLCYPRSGIPEALSVVRIDLGNNQPPATLSVADFWVWLLLNDT